MPGIDRTRPEDLDPIDSAAYLCWGSGRGDLYDAVHAMKRENERLREALKKIIQMIERGEDAWHFARSALQQKGTE